MYNKNRMKIGNKETAERNWGRHNHFTNATICINVQYIATSAQEVQLFM